MNRKEIITGMVGGLRARPSLYPIRTRSAGAALPRATFDKRKGHEVSGVLAVSRRVRSRGHTFAPAAISAPRRQTSGLGMMLQLVPSQCSVSVLGGDLGTPILPTAQMSFAEMAAIPSRLLFRSTDTHGDLAGGPRGCRQLLIGRLEFGDYQPHIEWDVFEDLARAAGRPEDL
jgi:hypothetical protein